MIILAFLLVVFAFYALLYRPKPRRRQEGNSGAGSYGAGNHGSMTSGDSGPSWTDGGSSGHHGGFDSGGHGGGH
ncbi:MAG TPA: hypothetical protein VL462_00645 [Candidatus Nitrosotalea sp.]|jgi:hypothetical protein|nr:hypothetical protein [Candidatus Nitrosotalea sp.]